MQKATTRRKSMKKVKNFLNMEIEPRNFLKSPMHIAGSVMSVFLLVTIVGIGINQPRFDKLVDSSSAANSSDMQIPDDPPVGGKVEGIGNHFEITDSQYLNLILDAADSVKVSMESIPEMVLVKIEAGSSDILSTSVTISGFLPSTTYHKYEDSYINHEVITSDESGRFTFTQNLADSHLIYFQPRPSTKIITSPTGGDCNLIGNWDESAKTCVLTKNINESIAINSNDITLDGNGYSLTGTNTGFGVSSLPYSTNVTIKNLTITKFSYGIYINTIANYTIRDCVTSYNYIGMQLTGLNNGTIEGNTLKSNNKGMDLQASSDNMIENNVISDSINAGLQLANSSNNNIISGNDISRNRWGVIYITSMNNVLDGNTMIANGTGLTLSYSTTSANRIVNNLIKDNTGNIAIRMYNLANGNIIYNNYFNNPPYFSDATPYNNVWNIDKTLGLNIVGGSYVGGNYWALKNGGGFSETCVDSDLDGICDEAYVVKLGDTTMVMDNLPLAKPDTVAPVTSIEFSGTNGLNSWYISEVEISLSAVDNLNGSGVVKTEYSFDNASWLTYNSPVVYGDEGSATIYYRSVDKAGNIEFVQTRLIKIDKSAPEISGTAIVMPNTNNWYKQNVVIKFNCNDAISGAVNSVFDNTISTEGVNQSTKGTCVDNAGNISELIVDGINIDKTIPVVSVLRSPNANSHGWNNTPVTVTLAATDAISDLEGDSVNVVVFNSEGSAQSANYNFMDKAGNIAIASVSGVNLDFTPPILTGSAAAFPNSNNWYNTDVEVNFIGSDALSGLASISPSTTLSFEGLDQETVGMAEDYAGNVASYKVSGINIDKTSPIITGAPLTSPNSNNWYNNDITIKFSVSDGLSGLSGIVPDAVISQEGAGQSVSGTATDKAGNTASTEISGINLDKTPPIITGAAVNSPNDNGWYKDNAVIHFESSDALSGINTITPDVIMPEEGANQSAQGEASDNAGNIAKYAVDGINIDKTSPITEAVLSGNSENNSCSTLDTSILLESNDNLSGVAETFFNLDNAGWFSYIGKILVGIEGQHFLKYNSKDKADNFENEKEAQFLVDKTPAEAVIKFDPQSKDIKVYNSKTGLEVSYTVVSKNISDNEGKGWDLRRYEFKSCGDNYISFDLKYKKSGKESMVKIASLQQNKDKKIKFDSTSVKAEYSVEKDGSIKELEQKIEADELFEIEAKYSANKNSSEIKLKLDGQKEKKETKEGMVILVLSTNKGSFSYQY